MFYFFVAIRYSLIIFAHFSKNQFLKVSCGDRSEGVRAIHNDIFLVSSSDIRSGVPERRSKSFNYICAKCLFDTILMIYRHTFYIE